MSSKLDRIIREVLTNGESTLLEADMTRRLDMLVRQGLMPASQLPILKRGLERFNQGKVPAPNERNAVNTLLNAMMFIVLGDDTVFNRARTSVQQKKYQTEEEKKDYDSDKEHTMDPTSHVKKEGDKFCVYDMKGKKVASFDTKDEADAYAKKNHDDLMNEEYEIVSEAYKTGHKSYTDAVNHAMDHHKKGGLESSADDRAQHIGLDSKKPGEGKTTRVNLPAKDKNGKKHMVHMQVYNKGGSHPYELNTYSSTTKALQKEEQLDEYGAMRSDKSSHDTGGMRISNADAADARERAVKKSAEKRASLAGDRAKKKSAEKRDKLSNIIKKNTIQKGPMKGYMTDETNQEEQKMEIDWSKNPFAQAKAMKEGAFKRMATDAEENRLAAERKAKKLTAKKGKEEKETDPGMKEEADHWSKDKTFHPTNTYHKHSGQFLKDKKAGKVTDMGRLKKSAQTGNLANPLKQHAQSSEAHANSSAELKAMKKEEYDTPAKKKPVSQMSSDEKKANDERRKAYNDLQKSKRNEDYDIATDAKGKQTLKSISKQMNKAVTRANAKLKEDLHGLPELDDMDLEMQENYQSPTKNNYSSKELRQAKGIAFDKRYKGGNMTGAAKAMEKIKKGLSDHPVASKALRKANEENMRADYADMFDVENFSDIFEMDYKEKFQSMLKKTGKKLSDMSDEDKKKFFNKVDGAHTAVNENKAFRDAARDYAKDDKRGLAPTKQDAPKVSDAKNAKEIEHIVPQMRKAISVGKKVQFKDGKHHTVSKAHAAKFLNKYMSGKPQDKEKMQSHAHASHKNFMDHAK